MKKIENILIPIFISILVFISFLLFMYFATFKYITDDTAAWGAFGDYIGGLLNPVFAFLSFSALIVTLLYQNKQLFQNQEILKETKRAIQQNEIALRQNRIDLQLSRKELKNSNKQLEISAKAQIEIEKTQKIQQFDMLFTTLLSELNLMNTNFIEKNKLSEFYEIFESNSKLEYKQVSLRKNYQLTRYFIILYQVLKQINDIEILMDSEKKKYSNIVRASLENSLLQLLMLNCNCEGFSDDFDQFYLLLEKFSFLEHMDFHDSIGENYELNFDLLLCLRNYKKQVFGNSIYFEGIQKIWYYLIINKNSLVKSKYQFFLRLLYMKPLSFCVEVKNYKIVLDLKSSHGRFPEIIITKNSNLIEKKINFDFKNVALSFYKDRVYAILEAHGCEIEFYLYENKNEVYIGFFEKTYFREDFYNGFEFFEKFKLDIFN